MIRPEELSKMNRDQLLEFAGKADIKVHPRSKDETIRRVIVEQLASRQMNTQPAREGWEEPKPKNPAPVFKNTPEEVLEALGPLANKEGFDIKFPGDNTVIFTYRGISESCNLSIPMHVIKRQAESAAKTKFAPKMVQDGEVRGTGVMMFG